MKAAWNAVVDFLRSEPVAIVAVITIALDLAVAFGAPLDPVKKGLIIGLADALLALFARSKVTPVASLPTAAGSVPESGIKPPAA